MSEIKENVKQLSFDEVKGLYDKADRKEILIDVRELEEYEEAHIPGVPLIPMSEIVSLVDQFKPDEEYVLICRSGRRSHEVAKFFQENGIERVHNYADGMIGWEAAKTDGPEWVVSEVNEIYK